MKSTAELEDRLSLPSEALISDLGRIDGDILILGAGGKMGPSLCRLASRALGEGKEVIAASRFSRVGLQQELEKSGIKTLAGDLLDEHFLAGLPDCKNVIFMAGRKFGTTGREHYTWAMNTWLPGKVAGRFRRSRIVVFSTGNVYPFLPVSGKGADESVPPSPAGEYAQSCLGRERLFEYFSHKYRTPVLILRLNYALDLRYGVLNEIARSVWNDRPVDLSMGHVNVIWQGDANEYALRSLLYCQSPPNILNVTGPEVISIKWLAEQLAGRMKKKVRFTGESAATALLSNAERAHHLFGKPAVLLPQMIEWTVDWVINDREDLGKPTHFQERGGQF